MFNESFFPTPIEVIDQMLAPLSQGYDVGGTYNKTYLKNKAKILEPSAGKGDILDRMVEHYNVKAKDICCIEIEPELQSILVDKGYRVIESDFMKYGEPYVFGLIVMNPPFKNGVQHLLKAWNILNSGNLVCLLNAETIRNPYTAERQYLLRLIEENGRYEFIGSVFSDAERKTGVECVIIWLYKPENPEMKFDNSVFEHEEVKNNADYQENPLASASMIQSLVDQYNQAVQLTIEIDAATSKYLFYVTGIVKEDFDRRHVNSLNDKVDILKQSFWKHVFDKTNVGNATTSNFVEDFQRFLQRTSNLAFSVDNIMLVLEYFVLNSNQIMQDCITSVFDDATKFHEKNIVHEKGEGWKTNKSWKIAPKIIMPNGVDYDKKFNSWRVDYYYRGNFFRDIDKILCFLSGKKIDKIAGLYKAIDDRCMVLGQRKFRYDAWFESEFFRIKFFKKGTVHLVFKDVDLLAVFNRAAATGKNWVGGGY